MDFLIDTKQKTGISNVQLLKWVGITSSKFYDWLDKDALYAERSYNVPRKHWILESEKESIINYAKEHTNTGYRRLCYMMLDEDVVAVSESTVYRILRKAGLLNRWNETSIKQKKTGFIQPLNFNDHWHIDIKYVNFKGTFLFLISIIDGYSRYIINHELRLNMQENDVEMVTQRALEIYPEAKPRIISDNGSQFISKDFASFLRNVELQHVRTSYNYPQSNGKIERFHRTINEECLQRDSKINLEDARNQIAKYIKYYNKVRLHSSLYYLTPDDYVNGRIDERLEVRRKKLAEARINRFLYHEKAS
jgi:transposase InsO family protein